MAALTTLPPHCRTWTNRAEPGAADHYGGDPLDWPPGPWDDEPDKVSWTDPGTGRPCLIVRGPMGGLCGYAAVNPGHPLHGADRDSPAVDDWELRHGEFSVHGGLTYAAGCAHDMSESRGICHIPEPGQPDDVWWFGFDCGHAFDLQPGLLAICARLGGDLAFRNDVYRTVGYVRAEVEHLAAQLTHRSAPRNVGDE